MFPFFIEIFFPKNPLWFVVTLIIGFCPFASFKFPVSAIVDCPFGKQFKKQK